MILLDSNRFAMVGFGFINGFDLSLNPIFTYHDTTVNHNYRNIGAAYLGDNKILMSNVDQRDSTVHQYIYDISKDSATIDSSQTYFYVLDYSDSTLLYSHEFPPRLVIRRKSNFQPVDSILINQISSLNNPRLFLEKDAIVALADSFYEIVDKETFASLGQGTFHREYYRPSFLNRDNDVWYSDSNLVIASEYTVERQRLGQPKAPIFDSVSYSTVHRQTSVFQVDTIPNTFGDDYFVETFSNWDFTLYNQSNQTLDSVAFRYFSFTPDPCLTDSVLVKLNNLNLAAGDSFSYQMDSVYRRTLLSQNNSLQIELKVNIASANGNIVKIGLKSIEVLDTTYIGLNEKNLLSHLQVFPNPAQNSLTISKENHQDLRFEILDVSGKILRRHSIQKQKAETKLDLSPLPSGMYFLKARSGGSERTFKILKN